MGVWRTARRVLAGGALALAAVAPTHPAAAGVRVGEDVFEYGDAGFHGSTGGVALNDPLVGIASTVSGNG